MKKIILLIAVLFSAHSLYAQTFTKNVNFNDYDSAEKASEYINFEMESTKLGMFTTSFKGYVKNFVVKAKFSPTMLEDILVEFAVKSMDTDQGSRNDKMYEKCFSYDKYPVIKVKFKQLKVRDKKTLKNQIAIINVRGKDRPILVDLDIDRTNGSLTVKGRSITKLSALEIPDPSIMIASVKDEVVINFSLKFKIADGI